MLCYHLETKGNNKTRWTKTSQLCPEVPTQGPEVPLCGTPFWIPKGYVTGGNTWPGCPSMFQWCDPLPLVWEGGPEWGTVVNHLQTVHYRLGLVCNKCNDCPSTSLDILHHHSQQDCQQSGGEGFQWTSLFRVITCRKQTKLIHLNQESEQRSPGGMVSLRLPYKGHPLPIGIALQKNQWRGHYLPTHASCYLFSYMTQPGSCPLLSS